MRGNDEEGRGAERAEAGDERRRIREEEMLAVEAVGVRVVGEAPRLSAFLRTCSQAFRASAPVVEGDLALVALARPEGTAGVSLVPLVLRREAGEWRLLFQGEGVLLLIHSRQPGRRM